jgi:hypothetical protein
MSFKVTNSLLQEAERKNALYHNASESVSSATTLSANIPITKVALGNGAPYTLTLPNGKLGQQKYVYAISGTSNVTVSFNNGWGSEASEILYDTGDLLIFYATESGWHCNDSYTD